METVKLEIQPIELKWSDWVPWDRLKADSGSERGGVIVPNSPGVYEAKLVDAEERLTIGKSSNLRKRIERGLVKGKAKHSSGTKIRKKENTSKIEVRWAETDRRAAAEEELHRRHQRDFGGLPKYTKHT